MPSALYWNSTCGFFFSRFFARFRRVSALSLIIFIVAITGVTSITGGGVVMWWNVIRITASGARDYYSTGTRNF